MTPAQQLAAEKQRKRPRRLSRVDKLQLELALNTLRQFDAHIIDRLATSPMPISTLGRVENAIEELIGKTPVKRHDEERP